jgi:hypothetical protein
MIPSFPDGELYSVKSSTSVVHYNPVSLGFAGADFTARYHESRDRQVKAPDHGAA